MPQDAKPNVKGGKKLPKAALPVGAVAVVLLVLYLKKKKAAEGETATGGSEREQLNRQSFIPVTGENVGGAGASGGGTAPGEGSGGLMELLKLQQAENKEQQALNREEGREQRKQEHEWLKELIGNLGTGGGAPHTGPPEGVTTAPPPPTAPPPAAPPPPPAPPPPAPPPPAPPPPAGCPPAFPNRGPHGCWRWSREKTGQGCSCHGYQNGTLECEHKVGGRCTF